MHLIGLQAAYPTSQEFFSPAAKTYKADACPNHYAEFAQQNFLAPHSLSLRPPKLQKRFPSPQRIHILFNPRLHINYQIAKVFRHRG